MFPIESHSYYGIHVKEQIDSLKKEFFLNAIIHFINGKNSKLNYLYSVIKANYLIFKEKVDIIHIHYGLSGIFLLIASACDFSADENGIYLFSYEYDFAESQHDWQHGFSDFPAGREDSISFALEFDYAERPGGGKALILSGNNQNSDLFMFIKKQITGLQPNADYTLTFDVELLGTVTGENVYLKVGATSMEPKGVIENGNVVMNIDKGAQENGGEDMIPIGNTDAVDGVNLYSLITRSNHLNAYDQPLIAKANSKGELWLIVGADSALKGLNTIYFTKVLVVLSSPD